MLNARDIQLLYGPSIVIYGRWYLAGHLRATLNPSSLPCPEFHDVSVGRVLGLS